jgi:uncharacterized protein (TIRG00374 family)
MAACATFSRSVPRKILVLLAKGALAGGLLFWLWSTDRLDFQDLLQLQPGRLTAALVLFQVGMIVLPQIRWYILTRAYDFELGLGQALHIGLVGMFTTIFIPAGLGVDGVKLFYLTRRSRQGTPDVLSTIIVDRVLGMIALMLLSSLFGGLLLRGSNASIGLLVGYGLALMLGLAASLALLSSRRVGALLSRLPGSRAITDLLRALQAYRTRRGILALALALSLLGHLGAFTAAYFAFRSLGRPGSIFAVFAITPIVNLSGLIPLTPLGLGVSDSIAATLYPAVGLSGGAEATMLLRCVTVAISLACGVAFLLPVAGFTAANPLGPESDSGGLGAIRLTAPARCEGGS